MDREEIRSLLFAVKPKTIPVDIPGIKGIFVRQMTGADRDEIENFALRNRSGKDGEVKLDVRGVRALTLICSVVDENGQPVFTSKDADAIASIPAHITDKIFEVCQRVNGQLPEEKKELGESLGSGVNAGSGSSSLP